MKTKHQIEMDDLDYPTIKEIMDWLFESKIDFASISILRYSGEDELSMNFSIKGDDDYVKFKLRWM